MRRIVYLSVEGLLAVGACVAAAMTSRASDWQPGLVVLLLALTIVGHHLTVTIRRRTLTASFVALTLAMTLLGPAPAVAISLAGCGAAGIKRRFRWFEWVANLAVSALFAVAGAYLAQLLLGNVHATPGRLATGDVTFAIAVFVVFITANLANFALIAVEKRALYGDALASQVRYLLAPMLPAQFATGVLAAILAVIYVHAGYPALLGLVVVLVIFQWLGAALLRSEERADQLEARSIRLASLQLGVLVTLVETLALRDRAAARHAAAVARYARALCAAAGGSEAEQETAHTAGLLHDIGRFALPDRVLHAAKLSEADLAIIRHHSQEGATIVGRLDGYGPVADAILYHHERIDGTGYPVGLIAREIPLISRVLAVCETYDTLTAADSYRATMTPEEAVRELRAAAGTQLDSDLVQQFIELLASDDPDIRDARDADFATELAFERRARSMALAPKAA